MSALKGTPIDGPRGGPLDLLRLVMRANLHPEDELHPSWLPADWPARHRRLTRLTPGGRAMLGDVLAPLLQQRGMAPPVPDYRFDDRLKRLSLLDGPTLRQLAIYGGLCAHMPLLKLRGPVGTQMRRQARRLARDAVEFVLERTPPLSGLRMDSQPIQLRPASCGRVVVQRGYRLLMGTLAGQGDAVLQRVQRKLPRRLATLPVPVLSGSQVNQMSELMLLCIVPERFPSWDWLF